MNFIKKIFKKSLTVEDVLYQHNISTDIQNIRLDYKKEFEEINNFNQHKYNINIRYDRNETPVDYIIGGNWCSRRMKNNLFLDLNIDSNYDIYKQIRKMEIHKEKTGKDLINIESNDFESFLKGNKDLFKLIQIWYEEIKYKEYIKEGCLISFNNFSITIDIAKKQYVFFYK